MLERDSYASLMAGALADGWLLVRLNDSPGGGRQPGDLVGLTHTGRGVLVEVKVSGRPTPSPHQAIWLTSWRANGGLGLLVVVTQGVAVAKIWQTEVAVSLTEDQAGRWRGWRTLDK